MIANVDPSQATFGKYQLLRRIAQGGMAEIFLANQIGIQGFEKLVVIKRVLPNLSATDDFITMFLDEARIAARLDHPSIVRIYDLGEENGQFFIAMEYIAGEDLASVIQQSKRLHIPLPPEFVADVGIGAAEALMFAHEMEDQAGKHMNLVHRDVSPSNILVTYQGGAKLVDFGIARAESNVSKTEGGQVKGKTNYLSPEQIRGSKVDGRTDIFALGITLHELLTGERLFRRDNALQTMNAILRGEVTIPSQLRPDIPPELDDIVMRALATEPEDRYQTAGELAADLTVFLGGRNWTRGVHSVDLLTRLFGEPRKRAKLRVAKGQKLDEAGYAASTSLPADGRSATGEFDAVRSDGSGSSPGMTPGGSRIASPRTPSSPSQKQVRPPTPSSPRPPTGSVPGLRARSQSNLPVVPPPVDPRPGTGSFAPPRVPLTASALFDEEEPPVIAGVPEESEKTGAGFLPRPLDKAPPKPKRTGLFVGLAAVLVLGVVGGVLATRGGETPVEPKPPVILPTTTTTTTTPTPTPTPIVEPKPTGLQVGGLRFTGVPEGAKVTVDGNPVGTPEGDNFFGVGPRKVKVEAKGFLPFEMDLVVAVGSVVEVPISLTPRPVEARGTLDITCQPWCQITVDGRDTGKTSPAKIVVAPGAHTLLLTNPPAGLAKKLTVTVGENAVVKKSVRLDE